MESLILLKKKNLYESLKLIILINDITSEKIHLIFKYLNIMCKHFLKYTYKRK